MRISAIGAIGAVLRWMRADDPTSSPDQGVVPASSDRHHPSLAARTSPPRFGHAPRNAVHAQIEAVRKAPVMRDAAPAAAVPKPPAARAPVQISLRQAVADAQKQKRKTRRK